jgi:hypothetical protein
MKIELSQVEGGADTIWDEGRAEAGGHGVLSPPSGAVGGNEDAGVQGGEVVEHAGDEGLEQGSVEVESAEQGVQWLVTRKPLGVAGDVDHAGVATPGQDR